MGTLPGQLRVKALLNLWVCFMLPGPLEGLSDQSWQKDGVWPLSTAEALKGEGREGYEVLTVWFREVGSFQKLKESEQSGTESSFGRRSWGERAGVERGRIDLRDEG